MLHKEFTVDGLDYVLQISKIGDVALALVGGNSRKGAVRKYDDFENLFPDEPIYDDVDLAPNVFAVFRKVSNIFLSFVFRERPWKISFRAATKRKGRIFRWMSKRFAKKLTGYCLVEFPDGNFNFYRLLNA